jgi:peroxiredoxin
MAMTSGPGHPFGWQATGFDLEGTDGKRHTLDSVRGPNGTLVMFICNHCPYVKAVIDDLVADCAKLAADGIGSIAVMSNDTAAYPADSFENMVKFASGHRFGFPYAIDPTQSVARSYGAACTPDFFGFDRDLKLRFRGRIFEMAPGPTKKPGARHELLDGMRHVAATGAAPADQNPSIGCSIKWQD